MRPEDLVFLMYAPNICCVNVTNEKPRDVQVDVQAGTWTTLVTEPLGTPKPRTFRIGGIRHFDQGCRSGGDVIGVYDRTTLDHLTSMVGAGIDATRDRGSAVDDD